jgi:hypothetical protein
VIRDYHFFEHGLSVKHQTFALVGRNSNTSGALQVSSRVAQRVVSNSIIDFQTFQAFP